MHNKMHAMLAIHCTQPNGTVTTITRSTHAIQTVAISPLIAQACRRSSFQVSSSWPNNQQAPPPRTLLYQKNSGPHDTTRRAYNCKNLGRACYEPWMHRGCAGSREIRFPTAQAVRPGNPKRNNGIWTAKQSRMTSSAMGLALWMGTVYVATSGGPRKDKPPSPLPARSSAAAGFSSERAPSPVAVFPHAKRALQVIDWR